LKAPFTTHLQVARSTIVKGAKKIHVNTSKKTILNNLTFEKGDVIEPQVLADNERIIRSLRYIEDAQDTCNTRALQ
jgi:hypothetical protein